MTTIREFYDSACKHMSIGNVRESRRSDGSNNCEVHAKIAYDFEANAKYWYFFVPDHQDARGVILSLLLDANTQACRMTPEGDGVQVSYGSQVHSAQYSNETLRFTGRVHVFVDTVVSTQSQFELSQVAKQKGMLLTVKDKEWAKKQSESEKPFAFISHDSRDKEKVVRPLVESLLKYPAFPIWYDEHSLKVGDSLRENIEQGLKEARKCVLILSPNFFANKGWGRAEYDSIFTRELLEQKNVILPVWCDVSKEDVYNYSPRLADKVGLPWSLGADEIARKLFLAIRSEAGS